MEPHAPSPSSRRRFLGRAAAVLGGFGVASRADPAGAQTEVPTTAPAPAASFGYHVPDLRDDGHHAAALQASIDRAAGEGGGVVLVPAGGLDLEETLLLPSHVTLRGMSMKGAVLRAADRFDGPLVLVAATTEGAAIESIALDGHGQATNGLRFDGPATFCIVRRVRIMRTAADGLLLAQGPYEHLSFEQVAIEDVGGDGVRVAFAACTSVFFSEVSVAGFGGASAGPAYGIRLGGRSQVTQVHVDPVGEGQTGIGFLRGSNRSTLTNYYLRLAGGRPTEIAPDVEVAVGEGAIE